VVVELHNFSNFLTCKPLLTQVRLYEYKLIHARLHFNETNEVLSLTRLFHLLMSICVRARVYLLMINKCVCISLMIDLVFEKHLETGFIFVHVVCVRACVRVSFSVTATILKQSSTELMRVCVCVTFFYFYIFLHNTFFLSAHVNLRRIDFFLPVISVEAREIFMSTPLRTLLVKRSIGVVHSLSSLTYGFNFLSFE